MAKNVKNQLRRKQQSQKIGKKKQQCLGMNKVETGKRLTRKSAITCTPTVIKISNDLQDAIEITEELNSNTSISDSTEGEIIEELNLNKSISDSTEGEIIEEAMNVDLLERPVESKSEINIQESIPILDVSNSDSEKLEKVAKSNKKLETSKNSTHIDEKPGSTLLEPIVRCEISEDVINFDESGNIIVPSNLKTLPIFNQQAKTCELCGATFKRQKTYRCHMLKHEPGGQIECNVCKKTFPYNRFMKHIMVHTGEKPHICEICGKGFRLKSDLKQHNFTHTGERPYPCDVCGKKFADASARRKHLNIHTGEKPYSCELCHRAFTQLSHLREHQVTHTGEKDHTCEMCGKKFTTKSSMQRHILTHNNTCEICCETFTTNVKLIRHMEMHNTSRPYSCPVCSKRFLTKTDMNTHALVHSEPKEIFCKLCNSAFKSYKYLRVHHRLYHREQEAPYACQVCNKGFFTEDNLKKHSIIHIPKRQVKCIDCNRKFSCPELLEQHDCTEEDIYFNCELCEKNTNINQIY